MADVLLREYLDELQGRIRARHYSDAFALGQHILTYYPKHLETYTLLAQASLETGDLAGATDLFRRVLGADPENVLALVGMALIQESRDHLEEALWYLERAFEVQPSNAEVRREILRLREAYYGAPPMRLELTKGGLARLYARQGQYSHAIAEFNKLLRGNGKRFDLRVALAECLYRAGRNDEAGALAQEILKDAPYALKLNLILGTLFADNGVSEGETYLQRALAVDPENRIARELIGAPSADAPAPRLPSLDSPRADPPVSDSFAPAISAARPFSAQNALTDAEAERAREMFRQLDGEGATFEPDLASRTPELDRTEPAAGSTSELEKDFLGQWEALVQAGTRPAPRKVEPQTSDALPPPSETSQPSSSAISNTPLSDQSAVASSLAPIAANLASQLDTANQPAPTRRTHPAIPKVRPFIRGAAEKIPAWLRLDKDSTPAPSVTESSPVATAPTSSSQPTQPLDDRPAWLVEAEQAREDPLAPQTMIELPNWLQHGDHKATPSIAQEPKPDVSAQAQELPNWLESSEISADVQARAEPSSDSTLPSEAPSTAINLPSWLSEPQPQTKESVDRSAVEAAADVDEQPLDRAEPDQITPPAWLVDRGSTPPDAAKGLEPQGVTNQVSPQLADSELPAWLQETPATAAGISAPDSVATDTPPQPAPTVIETAQAATTPSQAMSESAPPPAASTPARAEERAAVDSQVLLGQARERHANGDVTGALDLYERVMHRRPNYLDEVIADLQLVIQTGATPSSAHRLLGEAYAMAGRFKEALEQYRIAMGK